MRLVYYGTPSTAVPPLARLVADGRAPLLVVTRQDRPRGRGLEVGPSAVRAAAESMGLPVVTPARASAPEEIERIRALAPDLLLVVAYGQLLSPALLDVPRIGALNLHYSLLPRHRGASPVQAAILAGDAETGVTTLWMAERLDEGPLFLTRSTAIEPEENAGALADRLAALGADCLAATLDRIEHGERVRLTQDSSRATMAPRLRSEAGLLRETEDAVLVERKVRAFTPEPGAYFELEQGRLLVLEASLGNAEPGSSASPGVVRAIDRSRGLEIQLHRGTVWLRRVRPSGRRAMGGADYANGARLRLGARLPLRRPAA